MIVVTIIVFNILLLYFAFEAAIAALQVTMPICNKTYTRYNAAIVHVKVNNCTNVM